MENGMSFRSRLRPASVGSCARKHPAGMVARRQGAGGRNSSPFETLEDRRLMSATLLMSGHGAVLGTPSESFVDEGDYQLTLTASNLPSGVTVSQWAID